MTEKIIPPGHDFRIRQPEKKDQKLWRYLDFTKFVSVLATRQLFFCRADRFEDPYEGSYSKLNLEFRQNNLIDWPLQDISNLNRLYRKWTYINCWHANEHESAAMWKLYTQTNEALAIETDFESLSDAILHKNVQIGFVEYKNYEIEYVPDGGWLPPFFHKRKSFEHEREVRAVIQDIPGLSKVLHTGSENPLNGLSVDVDLHNLVKFVHISPTAPDWFRELTELTTAQFGFSFNVKKSNLYEGALF